MSVAAPVCPGCSRELGALARFCHDCGAYVDDMAPGAAAAPERAAVPPDDRSESEIQLGIRRALETLGFEVYDLSQDRPTRQTPGLGDLYVVGRGRCAWLEVKRPTGRQSEAQVRFGEAVTSNGGDYVVVRSETEAVEWAGAPAAMRGG